jgi:hypothetical protein
MGRPAGSNPKRTAIHPPLRAVLEQDDALPGRSNADPHPSNLIVSEGCVLNWSTSALVGLIDERHGKADALR